MSLSQDRVPDREARRGRRARSPLHLRAGGSFAALVGAIAVVLAGALPAVATTFEFALSGPYPVAPVPLSAHAEDLDGDGLVDLLVRTTGAISWLRNDGAGGFHPAQAVLPGYGLSSFEVGDFDEDGLPDLVAASTAGTVTLWLASGAGAFVEGPSIVTGVGYPPVAIGDFDLDGNLDLAVPRSLPTGPAWLSVLHGDGLGGFLAPLDLPCEPSTRRIRARDLDGDGDLELVLAHFGVGPLGGSVGVLIGGGPAGFAPEQIVVDAPVLEVEVGDLDGSGALDLVVVSIVNAGFCGNIATPWFATAFGGYVPGDAIAGACGPHAAIPADIDGDGVLDLLTTDGGDLVAAANSLDVRRGLGAGLFAPPETFPLGLAVIDPPAVADFDGDGRPDVGTAGLGNEAFVLRNETIPGGDPFRRGDVDRNGAIQAIPDALSLLLWGFAGGPAPGCRDAADADDDGAVIAIVDAVWILAYGFSGGPPPPAPFPGCGSDPSPDPLDCGSYDPLLCP